MRNVKMLIFVASWSAVVFLTGGCRSVSNVSETSWVDSISTVRHDTLMVEKWRVQCDTVREREVHTIVMDTTGRTYYEREVYHHYETHYQDDSTHYYKALADSLGRQLLWHEHKETVKNKTKHSLCKNILFICLILFLLTLLVLRRLRK